MSQNFLKERDEAEVTLRRRPRHRRQSSVGITFNRGDDYPDRRRYSYASSYIRDEDDDDDDGDDVSTRTGRGRPYSWGPVGEFFYRDSLSFCDSERSPTSHHECKFRSNDQEFFLIFFIKRVQFSWLYEHHIYLRTMFVSAITNM